MDTNKILRPLDNARGAIDKLENYESAAELSSSMQTTWDAVNRTLRNLLRADPEAPDELRLSALSSSELPHDRMIAALRQHNLISIQLAGMVHELELGARRIAQGDTRAADADHARAVVERLRQEIARVTDQPVLAAAHHAVEAGTLEVPARPVPRPRNFRRWPRILIAAAVILGVVGIGYAIFFRDSDFDRGVTAFQAERWAEAEQHFRSAAEGSDDATSHLYLARLYRQQKKYEPAATVLRDAATRFPDDDDVQRELGKLFLDLNRPQQAAERLRRATEIDAADQANWLWLVRALRAAGDPSAEQVLQEAPAEVRATLGRTN